MCLSKTSGVNCTTCRFEHIPVQDQSNGAKGEPQNSPLKCNGRGLEKTNPHSVKGCADTPYIRTSPVRTFPLQFSTLYYPCSNWVRSLWTQVLSSDEDSQKSQLPWQTSMDLDNVAGRDLPTPTIASLWNSHTQWVQVCSVWELRLLLC